MMEVWVVVLGLLLIAGAIAVLLGGTRDGLLVLVGLIPIVGAAVVTEYRGERALEALRDASAPVARVRRTGSVSQVTAASLVPGDVVLLSKPLGTGVCTASRDAAAIASAVDAR